MAKYSTYVSCWAPALSRRAALTFQVGKRASVHKTALLASRKPFIRNILFASQRGSKNKNTRCSITELRRKRKCFSSSTDYRRGYPGKPTQSAVRHGSNGGPKETLSCVFVSWTERNGHLNRPLGRLCSGNPFHMGRRFLCAPEAPVEHSEKTITCRRTQTVVHGWSCPPSLRCRDAPTPPYGVGDEHRAPEGQGWARQQ